MRTGAAKAKAPTDLRTCFDEGMEVTGEVRFAEVLRVDGRLSGTVISESGSLMVSERGRVQAKVEAGFVDVFGTVEGTITAKHKVEIRSTGRVYGDIYTPDLNIEDGAVFDGRCHMVEAHQPDEKMYQADRGAVVADESSPETDTIQLSRD